jgi:hypothetical protein
MLRLAIILTMLVFASNYGVVPTKGDKNQIGEEQWDKTRALTQSPFCALILREFLKRGDRGREIHILIEPDQVTEDNLRLLFKAISEKYPPPLLLEAWVYTDVEQLAALATRSGHSFYPDTRAREGKERQWAYYKRTEEVELFRYNPNYPESGMKTVILRGKEE